MKGTIEDGRRRREWLQLLWMHILRQRMLDIRSWIKIEIIHTVHLPEGGNFVNATKVPLGYICSLLRHLGSRRLGCSFTYGARLKGGPKVA